MKTQISLPFLISASFMASACGVAVYEDSQRTHKKRGEVTFVNETYDENIHAEFTLSRHDIGYISPTEVRANSRATRRFQYDTRECDPYSAASECKRRIQFYGDGKLRAYCYGTDVLEVDYSCDEFRCEPIQDTWANVNCHQII